MAWVSKRANGKAGSAWLRGGNSIPRVHLGGMFTVHTTGSLRELMIEWDMPMSGVMERLMVEAMYARHPEWYQKDFYHELEVEYMERAAQERVDRAARALAEAQAAAEKARRAVRQDQQRDRAA